MNFGFSDDFLGLFKREVNTVVRKETDIPLNREKEKIDDDDVFDENNEAVLENHVFTFESIPPIKSEQSTGNKTLEAKTEATKPPTKPTNVRDKIIKHKNPRNRASQGLPNQSGISEGSGHRISIEQIETQKRKSHVQPKPFACSTCGNSLSPNQYQNKSKGDKPVCCKFCEKSEYVNSQVDRVNCHARNGEEEPPWKVFDIKNGYLEKDADIVTGNDPLSTDNDPLSIGNDTFTTGDDSLITTDDDFQTTTENKSKIGAKQYNNENLVENDAEITTELDLQFSAEKDSFGAKKFKRSNKKVSKPKDLPCAFCDRVFTDSLKLNVHMQRHSKEQPNTHKPKPRKHQCSYCDKSFSKLSLLKIHERSHTGEKPFSCRFCDQSFSVKHSLEDHIRTHTGEKPFACVVWGCGKSFIQSSSLRVHLNSVHKRDDACYCSICWEIFKDADLLKDHQKVHRTPKQRKYQCSFCSKLFQRSDHLKTHERVHTSERPFVCNICGARYGRRSSLNRHMLIHNKENPLDNAVRENILSDKDPDVSTDNDPHSAEKDSFTTENGLLSTGNGSLITTEVDFPTTTEIKSKIDAKECNNENLVKNGVKVTTENNPQVSAEKHSFSAKKFKSSSKKSSKLKDLYCEFCDKKFTKSWNFKVHMQRHSKEQPVMMSKTKSKNNQCSYCNKSFANPSRRKIHERTHTGEKPFPCKFCDKSFSVKSALLNHERTHTGEKPFTCDTCGKSFSQSSYLRIHLNIMHKEQALNKMHVCGICGEKFTEGNLLREHQKVHRTPKQRKYQCSQCNQVFPRSHYLKTHERVHTLEIHNKEMPLDNADGKNIPSDKNAKINWKKQPGITSTEKSQPICTSESLIEEIENENLSCSVPTEDIDQKLEPREKNISTVMIRRRKYRLWTEGDINQYQCTECYQVFQTTIDKLQGHESECVPYIKKPFECGFCGKSFSGESHLENHIRTHTGEKPFVCNICGFRVSQTGQLARHMIKIHNNDVDEAAIPSKDSVQSSGTKSNSKRTLLDNHSKKKQKSQPNIGSQSNKIKKYEYFNK